MINHHRLRNLFSVNIQVQASSEDHNPTQLNSKNSQHSFIEDCTMHQTIWRVLLKNIWRRRKLNFHNHQIQKRNFWFWILMKLWSIQSLLMIRPMSSSPTREINSSLTSDLIVWSFWKLWAKFSAFMSSQLELKTMLNQLSAT